MSQLHHITTAKHFAAKATFQLYALQHQHIEVYQKLKVSWNGELRLHVPNYKMFLTLPKCE